MNFIGISLPYWASLGGFIWDIPILIFAYVLFWALKFTLLGFGVPS